jgi:ATP-dependent Clp protease protease subunit
MAIYDTMQQVTAPVSTVAVGITASFGTVLLTSGEAGMRLALPNATIHMHQPLGGAQGQASDIIIQAEEIVRLKKRLIEIFVHHTGRTAEEIERVTDRDVYMTAQEATDFGLIDSVLISEEREAEGV